MKNNSNINVVEEEIEEAEGNRFFDVTRKVLLAGIGAAALAQEEVETFVNKLVERGEIAEKDSRKLINEVMEKRGKEAKKAAKKAEKNLDKRMEEMLHRMNVPSKADIDDLSKKITALSRKIDQLKKEKAQEL